MTGPSFLFLPQKRPRVVQSLGASSVTVSPPETRLSTSHISAENNHSSNSNVVCTGELDEASPCPRAYVSALLNLVWCHSSVCLCEQARRLWPAPRPQTGAAAPGPLRSGSGQRRASAGGSGLRGLHVSALRAAVLPAEPVTHRRRGHQR